MTAPGGPAAPEQPGADRAAFLRWASGMPAAANRSLVVVTDGEGFLLGGEAEDASERVRRELWVLSLQDIEERVQPGDVERVARENR